MTNAAKTLVMTATYNEIENLPRLLNEVFAVVPDVDFLVVDDNSPDGTGDWCDRQVASEPRVHCIHRAGKLGLGTAIVAGMKYAIEHGYQYLLNMDADFSHHPRYLPAMIAGMDPPDGQRADVMIGSRYVPGGGTVDWPLRRRLMSRAVNAYARWMLWLSAPIAAAGIAVIAWRPWRGSISIQSARGVTHSRRRYCGCSAGPRTNWRDADRVRRSRTRPIEDQRPGGDQCVRIIAALGLATCCRDSLSLIDYTPI